MVPHLPRRGDDREPADGQCVPANYRLGEISSRGHECSLSGVRLTRRRCLENLGDREMVFMTVEFKDIANKPMALPPA
jgi:hypothetical protein